MKWNLKSTLLRNTGWIFLGQGLGIGFRAIYFIVIARLLGVTQYGVVVGAFALVNLVAEHSRLGTGTVLLRYVAPNHKRFSSYWGSTLIVTSLMSGILILALHWVAPHVIDPASAAVVAMTAIGSCLCEQLTISATQAFQAFQRMRPAAVLNQLTSLLRTIAALGMLMLMHHATASQWSLVSMTASAVATGVAIVTVTVKLGWPRFAPLLALSHSGEGLEYSISASASSAYNDLDKAMLSHYGMSAANGIYGMAYRIIEMGYVPVASIQLAASPRLFELAEHTPKDAVSLGGRLLRRGFLLSLGMAAVMLVTAPIIPLIVGKGFGEAAWALRWLCLIPVFRSVHGISGSVLTAIGRQRYRTSTQIVAVALNFALNLWLIPLYGWHGAAWSSLATDGSLGLLNWCGLQWLSRRVQQRPQPALNTLSTDMEQQTMRTEQQSSVLVSIIIPYYNHPSFLSEAVQSALKQTYTNVEIIVVDDGSSISASSVLSGFASITIFRTANGGVAAARNAGFALCSGDYLLFLDADDRLEPDAIEAHLRALSAAPAAAMSFGSARIIDSKGSVIAPPTLCRPRKDYFPMLLESNPIACPGSTMIRRSAFIQAGCFNIRLRNAEDYHLYLRLARDSPIIQIEDCVVEYRKHGGGKSQNKERMIIAVTTILDQVESTFQLSNSEKAALRRGRRRWIHAFRPRKALDYRLKSLYFSFRAMLTVPMNSYFRPRR